MRDEIWLLSALCALLTAEEAPDRALLMAEVGTTAGRLVCNVLVWELELDMALLDGLDMVDGLVVELEAAGRLELAERSTEARPVVMGTTGP